MLGRRHRQFGQATVDRGVIALAIAAIGGTGPRDDGRTPAHPVGNFASRTARRTVTLTPGDRVHHRRECRRQMVVTETGSELAEPLLDRDLLAPDFGNCRAGSALACSACFIRSRSGIADSFDNFSPAQKRSIPREYNATMAIAWLSMRPLRS